jgi:mRNA interferase MazF
MKTGKLTRGEVWLGDLSPTLGHEQTGCRPLLVVSVDYFHQGPSGLVVVLPITSINRGIKMHHTIRPPEGGLRKESTILCDAIRSIARDRLLYRIGRVSPDVMEGVEDRLRMLLDL